jgi:hypothetical protein
MPSIFDRMICQITGEIDPIIVAEAAKVRAAHQFGSPDFPPSYLREATAWCQDRAEGMRLCWRDHHGLPRERQEYVTITPFGRPGEGVRRSAF